MEKLPYKITASSVEEFNKIHEAVERLHSSVKKQVVSAETCLAGIQCEIKYNTINSTGGEINIPDNVTNIKQYDDHTTIVTTTVILQLKSNSKISFNIIKS